MALAERGQAALPDNADRPRALITWLLSMINHRPHTQRVYRTVPSELSCLDVEAVTGHPHEGHRG
jgi:hypothetical protein